MPISAYLPGNTDEIMRNKLRGMPMARNPFIVQPDQQAIAPTQESAPQQPQIVAPVDTITRAQIEVPQYQPIPRSDTEQRLFDLAAQQPQRAQFAHPGKLARLAAILSGAGESLQGHAGGAALTQTMLERPYNLATEDWQNRMKTLEPIATFETQRGRMAQTQYRSEITMFNNLLDSLDRQELNGIRQRHEDQLKQVHDDLMKYRGTGTEMEQFLQKEAARLDTQLKAIATRTTGQKEVAGITAKAAGERTQAQVTGRHQDVASQQAGAMSRAKLPAKPRALTPVQSEKQESIEIEKLLRKYPSLSSVVTQDDKSMLYHPLSAYDVAKMDTAHKDAHKLLLSKLLDLQKSTVDDSSVNDEDSVLVENLDEDEEN